MARRLLDLLRFAGAILIWPLSRRVVRAWGDEGSRVLPGDDCLPEASVQWTNGITVHARPDAIWPWLAQLGCNRAGWYSYDGLDNGAVPSSERVVPEFQEVAIGDVLPWTPTNSDGFVVEAVETGRALVLGGIPPPFTGIFAYVLEPLDGSTTRLLIRVRSAPRNMVAALVMRLLVHPVAFAMQRRQFLNIKRRVESPAALPAS